MLKRRYYYLAAAGISLLYFVVFFKLWEFNFNIPFNYEKGDGFFYKMAAKSIIEGNSYFINEDLAAPYGLKLYGFPLLMQTYLLFCKIMGFFTHNWVVIVNSYYFITYFAAMITFIYLCKKTNIRNRFVSFIGALAFSFSQYHLARGQSHMTASSYFVIPLVILLCYRMYQGEYEEVNGKRTIIEMVIFCIIIGCTDIYYAFFGCYLFCFMFLYALVKKRKKTALCALTVIVIVSFCVVMSLFPAIYYQLKMGVNETAVIRSPYEAYLYGFQIVSMFLPMQGGKNLLAKMTDMYLSVEMLPVGEGLINYIGILGMIGLAYMGYVLFFKQEYEKRHDFFIKLNLATIFLGTAGSFGIVAALLVTTKIRCYTRIFPFVFAFLLLLTCLFFQNLIEKYGKKVLLLFGFLFLIHSIDISPWSFLPNYQLYAAQFNQDKKFIQGIEQYTEDGDMILQLPYVSGVENKINGMVNCNKHYMGYLQQDKALKWSYGAVAGSDADQLLKQRYSEDIIDQILFFAVDMGYAGIYIDKSMLEESYLHIVDDMCRILGTPEVVSEDECLYYFHLENKDIYNAIKDTILTFGEGFYDEEQNEQGSWRWSGPESTLQIDYRGDDKKTMLELNVYSICEDVSLMIKGNSETSNYILGNEPRTIRVPIVLKHGTNTISFWSDDMQYEFGDYGRKLSFCICDIAIGD